MTCTYRYKGTYTVCTHTVHTHTPTYFSLGTYPGTYTLTVSTHYVRTHVHIPPVWYTPLHSNGREEGVKVY